jgi:hypothetical protein
VHKLAEDLERSSDALGPGKSSGREVGNEGAQLLHGVDGAGDGEPFIADSLGDEERGEAGMAVIVDAAFLFQEGGRERQLAHVEEELHRAEVRVIRTA